MARLVAGLAVGVVPVWRAGVAGRCPGAGVVARSGRGEVSAGRGGERVEDVVGLFHGLTQDAQRGPAALGFGLADVQQVLGDVGRGGEPHAWRPGCLPQIPRRRRSRW